MTKKKQQRFCELFQRVYEAHPAGGMLHIILDDGNTEDSHLEWNRGYINESTEDDPLKPVYIEMLDLMQPLTWRQRDNLIYKAWERYKESCPPKPSEYKIVGFDMGKPGGDLTVYKED